MGTELVHDAYRKREMKRIPLLMAFGNGRGDEAENSGFRYAFRAEGFVKRTEIRGDEYDIVSLYGTCPHLVHGGHAKRKIFVIRN